MKTAASLVEAAVFLLEPRRHKITCRMLGDRIFLEGGYDAKVCYLSGRIAVENNVMSS